MLRNLILTGCSKERQSQLQLPQALLTTQSHLQLPQALPVPCLLGVVKLDGRKAPVLALTKLLDTAVHTPVPTKRAGGAAAA